mmetsp:Transcript_15194/g.27547  ORF Transcript_15194/g.27547 Transcript_15194/m.27547 type:complete len:228 (+) Transcript_15194:131-814(+)
MKDSMNPTMCSPLAMRLSLVKLVQILMLPSVLCRPFSVATLPSERSAAFIPTLLPSSSLDQRRAFSSSNAIRNVGTPLMAIDSLSAFTGFESNILLSTANDAITQPPMELSELQDNLQIEQLSPTTTVIVFIIGIIPFLWATNEFWRRIAVGASFGTGSDSVVIPSPFEKDEDDLIMIGEDGDPNSSRGRQTLDRGALTIAYLLFAVAGGSVALALASVLMSPTQPM